MTGFSTLFWGFLFVFFDFRFNRFDLLPDLIGYIVVFSGFSRLASVHDYFRKAKYASIPLLLFSILDLLGIPLQMHISTDGSSNLSLPVILVSLAFALVDLYMMYHLCKGIGYVAKLTGEAHLQRMAEVRWSYYLWLTLLLFALPLLASVHILSVLGLLIIPLFILSTILYILLLQLLKETDRVCRSISLHD